MNEIDKARELLCRANEDLREKLGFFRRAVRKMERINEICPYCKQVSGHHEKCLIKQCLDL